MKVLFFSINNCAIPTFERELEVMADHQEQGDEVFVLRCKGSLQVCYSNPQNMLSRCLYCKARFSAGVSRLKIKMDNIFVLNEKVRADLPDYFSTIEDLKNFKLFGVDFGLGVASTLFSELKEVQIDTIFLKDKIAGMLKAAVLVYESLVDLFARHNFDKVYLFNGRFHDVRPALRFCEQKGIFYTTLEMAGFPSRYVAIDESQSDALSVAHTQIDAFWQDGSADKEALAHTWFKDRRNKIDQDYVSFVRNQKTDLLPSGFDANKRNIVLFNSSIYEFEAISERKNFLFNDEVQCLSYLAEYFAYDNQFHFYLRIHPNLGDENNSQLRMIHDLVNKNYPNLSVIFPAEAVDTYALMDRAEKVIVLGSTMGAEATYWGRPSILIGRAAYETLDCVYIPRSKEEFIDLLTSDLKPKPQVGSLKYVYWFGYRGRPYKRYQPQGLFVGTYEGRPILPRYSLKKIPFWSVRLLEKFKGRPIKARTK